MHFKYPATQIRIMSRPKFGRAVEHDAILRESGFDQHLIELHPVHGLRVSRWAELAERSDYEVTYSVAPSELGRADTRLHRLLRSPPRYSLTDFNCQDAAAYVATGKKESRDRRSVGTFVAVLAAVGVVAALATGRKG